MRSRALIHDRPGSVGLLTSATACSLRATVDEDLLGIIGATEANGVVVVVGHAKVPVMAVLGIVPAIGRVRPPRIEAVIIGLIGVGAIRAVHVAGKRGTKRTTDNDPGHGPRGTVSAASGCVAQESA